MINITMLGTSGSAPTKSRGLPSMAVEHDGSIYLFDCGEGTQFQLLRFNVNSSKIKAIFITHIHGDHVIGFAGLIRSMALTRRTSPLYVFIPAGYEDGIKALIDFDRALIGYKIVIKKITGGMIYKEDGLTISAFPLIHTVKIYGFAIKEADRLHFLKEKCTKLGMHGIMFKKIMKEGSIRLGKRKIRLKDVTTLKKGAGIVYAVDTRPSRNAIKAAWGADAIIHEATYSNDLRNMAVERKHTTAIEAAMLAKKAHAKLLILTHISARYRNANVLLKEARSIFKNTILAKDGLKLVIRGP